MEKEKYVDTLLAFNKREITEKKFVNYLNSETELQNIYKSLKSFLAPSDNSIVDWINKDLASIGTQQDKKIANTGESSSVASIHFYVKELLSKKYFNLLDKSDAKKFVLNEIECGWLNDASFEVEEFIKTKILMICQTLKNQQMRLNTQNQRPKNYLSVKVNSILGSRMRMGFW